MRSDGLQTITTIAWAMFNRMASSTNTKSPLLVAHHLAYVRMIENSQSLSVNFRTLAYSLPSPMITAMVVRITLIEIANGLRPGSFKLIVSPAGGDPAVIWQRSVPGGNRSAKDEAMMMSSYFLNRPTAWCGELNFTDLRGRKQTKDLSILG